MKPKKMQIFHVFTLSYQLLKQLVKGDKKSTFYGSNFYGSNPNIYKSRLQFIYDTNLNAHLVYNFYNMEQNHPLPTEIVVDEKIKSDSNEKNSRSKTILFVILAIVILGLVIFAIVSLFQSDLETTSRVRDIFIILMAFESILLGVALIVLIIQVAILTNVLQNEIKPIINTTNETVNNLKGTTEFLSNKLVEPVIKMNEYMAGLKKFYDIVKPPTRSAKK